MAFTSDGSRLGTRRVNQATGPEVAALPPRDGLLDSGHGRALPFRSSLFFPSWQGVKFPALHAALGVADPPEVKHAALVVDLEHEGVGAQPSTLRMAVRASGCDDLGWGTAPDGAELCI